MSGNPSIDYFVSVDVMELQNLTMLRESRRNDQPFEPRFVKDLRWDGDVGQYCPMPQATIQRNHGDRAPLSV